jgi:hypothetical protein
MTCQILSWAYKHLNLGYPSSPYILRPFTDPEVDSGGNMAEQYWHQKFNICLSSIHISIEHTFGLLKGRFPALKVSRRQVSNGVEATANNGRIQ